MYQSGIDNQGDFDQLSLAGVDFGEDYCENYGIEPISLEGEVMYAGVLDQMGMDYNQMGVVPEGLGADFDQMGIIPTGLNGQYNQLGHGHYDQQLGGKYNQLGGKYQQLGIVPAGLSGVMDTWNGLSNTHKMMAGVAFVLGGVMISNKMGYTKIKIPFIG